VTPPRTPRDSNDDPAARRQARSIPHKTRTRALHLYATRTLNIGADARATTPRSLCNASRKPAAASSISDNWIFGRSTMSRPIQRAAARSYRSGSSRYSKHSVSASASPAGAAGSKPRTAPTGDTAQGRGGAKPSLRARLRNRTGRPCRISVRDRAGDHRVSRDEVV
jgi:hypothetical protein